MCNAMVFVVDCNDRDRLHCDSRNCGGYCCAQCSLHNLLKMLDADGMNGWPVLILANKQDLPNALSTSQVACALGIHEDVLHDWSDKGIVAFLLGTHPRVGSGSVLRELANVSHLLQHIWSFVTLQYVTREVSTAFASRRRYGNPSHLQDP